MPDDIALNQHLDKGRFPWKLALPLYGLSNVIMLLFLKAYFWDDWSVYFSKSDSEIRENLRLAGMSPTRAFVELNLLGNRPELFRVCTIAFFFFSGWFLFHILSTVEILSAAQIRLITILFLILPINSARVSMNVFNYSFSFFLFFLAWYLLATKRSRVIRLLAIAIFIISFNTVALVAFFAVPSLHFLYLKLRVSDPKKWSSYFSSAWLALLAPVYWLVDRQVNPPEGASLAMYTPQKLGVFRGLLLLGACGVLIFWLWKSHVKDLSERNRYAIIVAGLTITAFGAFPYIVGGHLVDISDWMTAFVPRLSDWDSRHQLLLGLGFAVTITGVAGALDSKFKRQSVFVIFGLCVIWNMTYMHSYYLDSLKQDQVIEAFRNADELRSSRIIMVNDLTDRFKARGRNIRPYEWEGMMAKAFGDNSRLAISGSMWVECSDPLIPDTLLTITATNGRLEATLTRDIGIVISVEKIQPCK